MKIPPPPPANRKPLALVALIATALLAFVPLEQSQAQLYIDVYQSQDNPTNQTLWIFSGSGTTRTLYSVRNSNAGNDNRHRRDTWEVDDNSGDLYAGTEPNNLHIALSPLLSSSNAKDIASINARIPGGGKTNITFKTGNNANRNRTISHMFMSGNATGHLYRDDMGIRVSGGSFTFQNNDASSWSGAGLLNKPFSEFETGSTDGIFTFNNQAGLANTGPAFAANSRGSVQVRFHRGTIIPEPEEYALVFGLFALGFVVVRRHRQKKRRQQTATS